MSTSSQNAPKSPLPKVTGKRVAIISAEWNSHITDRLKEGAMDLLQREGFPDNAIGIYHVPGAIELTFAASRLIDKYDAIIVLGCVVRGGTPHFDYVCQSVTQGVTELNAKGCTPVIFGVLTVDCEQDAMDRAGGCLGNKGVEAAETAIKMLDFVNKVTKPEP